MNSRIIALLTDFGTSDSYVAAMKGAILSIAPNATIVDISHAISPQNIAQGSYLLWSVHRFFPAGTIFVAVVDPGVGSNRKMIIAKVNGQFFVAPDNGILDFICSGGIGVKAYEISQRRFLTEDVSRTFHGHDILAPVAAHLARRVIPSRLGRLLHFNVPKLPFVGLPTSKTSGVEGKVLHIDHFGNVITNIRVPSALSFPEGITITIGRHMISQFSKTYAEATTRGAFMIIGSNNLIELSIRNGNGAKLLRARLDQKIVVEKRGR